MSMSIDSFSFYAELIAEFPPVLHSIHHTPLNSSSRGFCVELTILQYVGRGKAAIPPNFVDSVKLEATPMEGAHLGKVSPPYPFPDDLGSGCGCGHPKCGLPPSTKERSGGVHSEFEYEDRDPNRINQHVQVLWEDVVAEPDGVRAPDWSWRLSALLFRSSRRWGYALLSLMGPPLALILGLLFAITCFVHIWLIGPALRLCRAPLAAIRHLLRSITQALLAPISEGLCWPLRPTPQAGATIKV